MSRTADFLHLRDRKYYYYERHIPVDVRAAFPRRDALNAEQRKGLRFDSHGQQAGWRICLGTGDSAAAAVQARALAVQHDAEMAAYRERQRQGAVQRAFADLEQVMAKAGDDPAPTWTADALAAQAAVRAAIVAEGAKALPAAPRGLQAKVKAAGGVDALVLAASADAVRAAFAAAGAHEMAAGIEELPKPAREDMLIEIDHAKVIARRATERHRERQAIVTALVPDAAAGAFTATAKADEGSLQGVYDRWKAETRKSAHRHHKVGVYVRRFVDVHGNLPVQAITKTHVKEYAAKLAAAVDSTHVNAATRKGDLNKLIAIAAAKPELPRLSQGTIQRHIEGIRTVLAFAEDCELVTSNVASRVKAPETARPATDVQPFRPAELRKMLDTVATVWTAGANRDSADRHWIVQVAVWNGARLEEICQLRKEDIRRERGMWVIDINRNHGKRTKNAASVRKVPLHPHLIEAGFVEHVQAAPGDSTAFVFPTLKPSPRGDRGHEISRVFGVLKKQAGFAGRERDFHSFRHSFKDACREGHVPEDVQEALMGHTGGNRVAGGYGAGHSLATMLHHLQNVDPLDDGEHVAEPKARRARQHAPVSPALVPHSRRQRRKAG